MNQQIYALRLTNEEAEALLSALRQYQYSALASNSRALSRVYRRLERIVDLIDKPERNPK